jgi:hypothetical protein
MSESKKSIQEIMDYYNNPVPQVPKLKIPKVRKDGERVIRKFKKGSLLPPKTITNFTAQIPDVTYREQILQELEKPNKRMKKEVLRKPVWKYSPAMKKDALEKFIKEHGIPAPDHPKRAELMLLVSDYVTHLIMDDMRRHEQGEPLQNSSRAQIEAMKAQLKGLNIPSVASVDFPEVQVVRKPKKDSILERFKKGELLYNNKLLVDKPFKNLKSKLRPKAKPQRDLKAEIEAMKAQLKGLKIPSLASVDFPKVEIKKPKVEIKKEPKKEIVIDKEPIGDKTKYTPKDFTQADIDSVLNDIKKVEKKLEKPKNLEEYRKLEAELTSLLNEAQRLKAEMNRGDGRRRRNRGGNFGEDLLGVLSKIGKVGTNIPLIGPAFIPMSKTNDIAKFIKNI